MLMEKIYWGEFDQELLRISGPGADERKVSRILERYRDVLKDYPPGKLEARGRTALRSLAENGRERIFRPELSKPSMEARVSTCRNT